MIYNQETRYVIAMFAMVLLAVPPTASSAQTKQGGGAFSIPKPAKKKTRTKRSTKPAQPERKVIAASYNADYRVRFNVIRDYATSPCWSGQRNIAIRGNRTKMKINPLPLIGDVLGQTLVGSVSNGQLYITNSKGGIVTNILHRWRWNGTLDLPPVPGATSVGTVTGSSGRSGCDWNVQITRLN